LYIEALSKTRRKKGFGPKRQSSSKITGDVNGQKQKKEGHGIESARFTGFAEEENKEGPNGSEKTKPHVKREERLRMMGVIPFIKNKDINYRDLFGIFRLSFLVNIQNINFEKMLKISQRFHANLFLYF